LLAVLGTIVDSVLPSFRKKFYRRRRRFGKRGSIISFEDVPVPVLEEFRDDVLFLFTEARVGGTRIDLEPLEKVFVVDYGVGHYPQKLKYRFRP